MEIMLVNVLNFAKQKKMPILYVEMSAVLKFWVRNRNHEGEKVIFKKNITLPFYLNDIAKEKFIHLSSSWKCLATFLMKKENLFSLNIANNFPTAIDAV